MKIKANTKNYTVDVVVEGMKYSLKIKNLAHDRHSFPRWAIIDTISKEVMASLSGGGSYGWIIHAADEKKRWWLLKASREAQKANLGWPWTNVQC